jgi:ATP synthase protein I
MNDHDVRILRGAAIPTGVVGLLVVAVSAGVAGGKGALGAVLGTLLVAAFFTVGVVVIAWASRINPFAMLNVAIATYLVKIALLAGVLVVLADTTVFETRAFAAAIALCTVTWTAAQVRAFGQEKFLYVEPDREGSSSSGEGSG